MDLQLEFQDLASRFQIFAVHATSPIATVEERIPAIEQDRWRGRRFSLPIVVDLEKKTFDAYAIRGMPSEVLIDPEGKVVAQLGAEERLREVLLELRNE